MPSHLLKQKENNRVLFCLIQNTFHLRPVILTGKNFQTLCDKLATAEIVFKNIIARFGYPPFWQRPASFETLVHYILEQQVSLASARAALQKLREKLVTITPQSVLSLTDQEMRACYVSRQKAGYTRHLANCVLDGSLVLEALQHLPEEDISKALQRVKGIGDWTSDVFMMMSLHRSDRFPIGDIALRKSMITEFSLPVTADHKTLMEMAEKWRPYRTVAAFMLWHSYLGNKRER